MIHMFGMICSLRAGRWMWWETLIIDVLVVFIRVWMSDPHICEDVLM
jgi:hypothetical protein